nr:hypothetical protein [Tanacetum cinerariifolium]
IRDSNDPLLEVYIESRFPVNSELVELLTFPPPVRDSPKGMLVIVYRLLAKVKTSLGYDSQFNEKEVPDIKEEEVTKTVFDNCSSNKENSLTNDRFKKGDGYDAVPPPLTGNYMSPKPDLSFAGLDDSIYKFKISETVASLTKDEKDALETSIAYVEKPKEDRVKGTGHKESRPVWNNVQRINHQNKFAPTAVFTRSGRMPLSTAKPKAAASTSTAKPVNTAGPKQSVNFSKSRISVVKGNRVTAVKTSTGCVWRPIVNEIDQLSKDNRRLGHVNFKTMNKLVKGNLAEAVNTAWYVLNRALVTKTHNKTPYELLNGRTPRLYFMRPFGCLVTILNTLDPLAKFKGKVDEGFLVEYSVTSKDFRVFNTKIRKVEENLHFRFLENKPNVAGTGPNWLFNIGSLTNSKNYIPVSIGNRTDKNAGPQDTNGNADTQDNMTKLKMISLRMILVQRLLKNQSIRKKLDRLMSQEIEPSDAANSLRKEFEQGCMDQRRVTNASNTNNFNTVSNPVNSASPSGTFSVGGPSSPYPNAFIHANTILHVDQDDSQIHDLEDTIEL